MADNPYQQMAAALPNDVAIGGALITMVEPDVGHERAYNRWYEDDHFYSGAMFGPWMFTGRRWVATRDLLALRFPEDSPVATPVTAGCYISTYFMVAGHYDDAVLWGKLAMRDNLYPNGRGFDHRQHVYTAFSTYDFGVVRDAESPLQPHHALDHPFAGMVVEVVEPTEGVTRQQLVQTLRDEVVPAELKDSSTAIGLAFGPEPQPDSGPVPRVGSAYGTGTVITLLWFLQEDPRRTWSKFQRHPEIMAAAGGRVVFAAPFIPTVVGTDTYLSELR